MYWYCSGYTVKKVTDSPVFSRDVTVWLVTSRLGTGKSLTFFCSVLYLLYVLHPLGHLLVAHVVHLLDEVVVLLPERHLRAGRGLPLHIT